MTKLSLTTIALVLAATPLAAQINPRGDRTTTRSRIETVQDAIEAARRDGRVDDSRTATRGSAKIPPGHLPPRGMCRVWIDGVPPGQQPAVTTCAQAERDRFRYSNARVIYGDRDSFPGKGKGKFKDADQRNCTVLDGVVIDGRVRNVCRDDSMHRDGHAKAGKAGKAHGKGHGKAQGQSHGKHGRN